jgi:hypothetical protein
MTGNSIEITEFTIGYANIGGIHISVDLPTHLAMGNLFFS